jgi:glutathione S-transferase
MNRMLDVATSLGATLARFGAGLRAERLGNRPAEPLELYEYEGCPYCRKVREAMTALDLEAIVYPCPKGGTRFREVVRAAGGKAQFPYLVDPNTGESMYESDAIVDYLFARYGAGGKPWLYVGGPLANATSAVASGWRLGLGLRAEPSKAPAQPLEVWSFEASPFCRIVRETLSTLEIPYLLHNVGKGSPSRERFVERAGKMQVPFLFDPNTQIELFESADIVEYLRATYAASGRA